MTLSVVIPTKNRPKELIKIFDSLINQTYQPDQIIIIDQSDDEKVVEKKLIKKTINTNISLDYIHDKSIKGLVQAKTHALRHNKSEIISFFDDDIVLNRNYLEKIKEVFIKEKKIIGANGVILNFPKKNFLKRFFFNVSHVGIYSDNRYDVVNSINNESIEPKLVNTLSGGLSSWRKDVFKEVKFDSINNFHAYEDKEFSLRVNKKYPNGMYIIPEAKLNHFHSKINRETILRTIKMNIFEIIMIYKKNRKISFFGIDLLILLFSLLTKSFFSSLLNLHFGELRSFFIGLKDGCFYKIKLNGNGK